MLLKIFTYAKLNTKLYVQCTVLKLIEELKPYNEF